MIVCLDTNAFIWGVRGHYDPNDAPKGQQAKNLIKRLNKADIEVIIPSCVMSEALSIFDESKAREYLKKYRDKFILADMDAAVTFHLSRLLHYHYKVNPTGWKEAGMTKRHLKYDALIIATAIANNAKALFTHDKGIAVTAAGRIEVCGLDDMPSGFDTAELDTVGETVDDDLPF